MRAVDDVVLADLDLTPGVDIYDGVSVVDISTNKVIYDLPLAVYRSNIGDDADDSAMLDGFRTRRSVFFDLTYLGVDRNQAKAAGEKLRARLERRRFVIPGFRTWPCRLESSTRVFRDDDAVTVDGSPLFYGVDSYDISIRLTQRSTYP